MESAYVCEQNAVIDELTQGIQMAKQLRFNLNTPEARQFYMQKILSSYENALCILKSGDSTGQPQTPALPGPGLLESLISKGSPESGEFEFDQPFIYQYGQNVVSRKRKGSTISEAVYKGKHTCNIGVPSAVPPPHSPQTHEIIPMYQLNHYHHQLSPPKPREMTTHLLTNLSFKKWVFEEDYQQLQFPSHFDDELLHVYSPPLLAPTTSESSYPTEWGNPPSLDFCANPADVDLVVKFCNSYF
ncbi:WRKY53 [Artemisia annua]|uniref:WRKY53 n=1 Tax=Artemisia annua TaxID=35608 RepID=A0A2U1PQ44_ARTAN|nr:WRKY53 [Artemisia annua]